MTKEKRGMTSADLHRIRLLGDPQFSPQGDQVAYVVTMVDEDQQYRSQLCVRRIDDGLQKILTNPHARDSHPRWSPDGSQLCFVSDRSGRSQLWLLPAAGGEPRQLTNCPSGAREPVWSPDGRSILFSAWLERNESIFVMERDESFSGSGEQAEAIDGERLRRAEAIDGERLGRAEQAEPTTEASARQPQKTCMVVNRLKYKSDELGFILEKTKQLAIVDVTTGEVRQITTGEYDHSPGTWSPDGKWLAITANRAENPDVAQISDVYLLSPFTGEWKKLTDSTGNFFHPTWSPDGSKLAYIGSKSRQVSSALRKVWVYDLKSGQESCLTAEWDVHVGDVAMGDMRSAGHPNPGAVWSLDGQGVYFIASERGSTGVFYAGLNGQIRSVIGGKRHVYGLTFNPQRSAAVAAISDPVTPGDLHLFQLETGEERRLTWANRDLLEACALSVPEELEYMAHDGLTIQGWIMKPTGFQEGNKYPLILQIHGGPHTMYGYTFFHEFQVLAAKGYAVLFTNPRGSHGYGQQFVRAVCGDYGGNDYRDLMDGIDYALSRFAYIDRSRLGVTGGSYGGFMTNWIVGQTNRFQAAVTDRSISNWLSFYGVSDIGYTFTVEEIGAPLYENPEKLWHHSPLRLAARMETPLLIMHGEIDYRCPIEQAEQLFVTLKRLGKAPVSLVRFPRSSHELSRSGDPKLRVDRLDFMTDWFDHYLMGV